MAVLVVYDASAHGDALLRETARDASLHGEHLSVAALAYREPVRVRCCNFQSGYWNGVQRELAENELGRARLAVEDSPSVDLRVVPYEGFGEADAIAAEAVSLGASRIVVAARLGRRALRRLRRLSERNSIVLSSGPSAR